MNHRSHENTEHNYCTGIPVKMPLVDANPLQAEVDRLREELAITDKLLDAANDVLNLIPECPIHGFCHTYQIAWIKEAKEMMTRC